MAKSFTVPTSVKLRLCQPNQKTLDLSRRLEGCGASWITLHARTVSARRRRQGAADLSEVKRLKEGLSIPVISNGNVRAHTDLWDNLSLTGADGVMVGETLLGNPWWVPSPSARAFLSHAHAAYLRKQYRILLTYLSSIFPYATGILGLLPSKQSEPTFDILLNFNGTVLK